VLPSDRYIASLLGLTDEQYEYWKDYVAAEARKDPQPSVVCGDPATIIAVVSLVLTVVGVGFQIIGFLLQRDEKDGPQLRSRQRTGINQTGITSFAPRAGFDATQEVAGIGAPIPVVYANRETLGGQAYGGVRANLSLLWSQIWSLGGSQMLRSVFMIGEGNISSIDPNGFAIGDNSLGSYDLLSSSANEAASRLTIYYRSDGGRIVSGNRIAGRSAANDAANAQNDGASDVFQLRSVGNTYAADFSSTSKPSTSTRFGVYTLIGNNLGFKLSPRVRSQAVARLKPRGSKGNSDVVCDVDLVVKAEREKFSAYYSSRSGITSGSFGLGNTFTYTLDSSSDYLTTFQASSEDGGTWSSSFVVEERPRIYTRDTTNRITGFGFGDVQNGRMTVGGVTVASGGDALEVTATFDVATVRQKLVADNAARGQYVVRYFIQVANSKQTIQSQFDITITVQSEKKLKGKESTTFTVSQTKDNDGKVTNVNSVTFTPELEDDGFSDAITFLGEVDEDSGPVVFLASPERLQAKIVFPVEDLDAYSVAASDVAASVTGRQKAWDDAIVVGDLYKVGSALAVCTSRSPNDKIFISDSEDQASGTGQSITATFRVVRAGSAATVALSELKKDGKQSATRQTATSGPHLMKVAVASFSTLTECRLAEIGIRSNLGTRINGICNFVDTLTLEETDQRACLAKEGNNIKRGNTVKVDLFQSGTISVAEDRYSFFKIGFREVGSTGDFTYLSPCFGVRGMTQQESFSYIRLQMPSRKRWEYRMEPLSGWEIRSSTASGTLVILDAKLSSSVSGSSGGVTWYSNGQTISRSRSNFTITSTRRGTTMGYPRPDENNYLDAWGKLAESFVYEEAQSSAEQGPEHEVVYVNEISQNSTAPNYDGIAILGMNIRSSVEWSQFRQLSVYVIGGAIVRRLLNNLTTGPSHLFPDIALDRFTNAKYGPGRINDQLIDLDSFQSAAQWCFDRRYFFDGAVMLGTNSPRQWAADVASTMLLDFKEVNGRYALSQAISFSAIQHKALFTAGNIEEGSFKLETFPVDDLRSVRVSAKWREERSSSSLTSPGFFPIEREVLVREASPNGSDGDPVESVDLTDYVTNEEHAIDVCKFRIRAKRIRDHSVRFTVTYSSLEGVCRDLSPGDYIKIALDSTIYNQLNNGAVLGNGTVVSTTNLEPGTYSVLAWDGSTSQPSIQTLSISPTGTGSPSGIVFTVTQSQTQVRTYQISKISPTDEGKFDIDAVFSPVNASGILLMAENWDNAGSWVISR
jgi:hypothetical protein